MELTERQRNFISRSTAAVLAALLGFGAYRCFRAATASADGTVWLLVVVGVVVGLLCAAVALYVILPSRVFQWLMGPPKNTSLGERPDADSRWHWTDLFWWWV
jgi:hypothetical protein